MLIKLPDCVHTFTMGMGGTEEGSEGLSDAQNNIRMDIQHRRYKHQPAYGNSNHN